MMFHTILLIALLTGSVGVGKYYWSLHHDYDHAQEIIEEILEDEFEIDLTPDTEEDDVR